MKLALVTSALALLIQGADSEKAQASATVVSACPGVVQGVYYYRGQTRLWERKQEKAPSKSTFNASLVRSCKYTIWVAHHWKHKARAARQSYLVWYKERKEAATRKLATGALTSDWACIHSHEGDWNANTGNGYYGGLQMDYGFMQSYGAEFLDKWGTADNWPVWAQVTAATRARDSGRGYSPWPNTARMCGLL